LGVIGGVVVTQTLNEPYRTLQVFPVTKYLDSPRALAGSKFKAELRVEANLTWKEEAGRLMQILQINQHQRQQKPMSTPHGLRMFAEEAL
jgi:hypothetical protein